MEAKHYRALYQLVRSTPHTPRLKRERFSDWWVLMVRLWAVPHDRSQSWACDPANWPEDLDRPLTSQSRRSRRLRAVGVLQLLERVLSRASDLFGVPPVKQTDSKPLTVGAYSQDADAKRGRTADGQFAKGYRLHAICHGRAVRHFTPLPPNEHDSAAAPALLPRLEGGGYVLGDNAYDTNDCHGPAAANHPLVAPPRECNKDVRDAKYNRPQRLRALDMPHSPPTKCGVTPPFGRDLYDCRRRIESALARCRRGPAAGGAVGGGEDPGLPRPDRTKTRTYGVDP